MEERKNITDDKEREISPQPLMLCIDNLYMAGYKGHIPIYRHKVVHTLSAMLRVALQAADTC